MKDKIKIIFDKYELGILINAVNEFRTIQMSQDNPTDSIDDLLLKLVGIYEMKCPITKLLRKDYDR